MTDYAVVICPWLQAHGQDPRTYARDGFCAACGATDHERG
jgi:hypothetical protein